MGNELEEKIVKVFSEHLVSMVKKELKDVSPELMRETMPVVLFHLLKAYPVALLKAMSEIGMLQDPTDFKVVGQSLQRVCEHGAIEWSHTQDKTNFFKNFLKEEVENV